LPASTASSPTTTTRRPVSSSSTGYPNAITRLRR